ncbi:hypothetical protein BT63DRAFT_39355 [Microthyrium microscopicum]|uniref:Reticulon-like protein n=1 Tax=Microthyrium microscopicum TaxID=703497 RepID=A0A6A6UTA3_9PEZI|nr:hypothetical protein BT63DRAFT_39355 [Microthyrium microscopicum]
MDTVANHPVTQQATDAVVNGPVGQAVSSEKAKTSAEFQDLADSRKTPSQPAATGQPLTHYHSLIYRLLSWKNPRATGITFATIVSLIFVSRYVDIMRYTFRALYTVLGGAAAVEVVSKQLLGNGFATQMRPKKYYTIRKESLERFLDDVEQMINFVVIEFQRIIFVENVWATAAAFLSSFASYWLIKWLPLWGLTLLSTIVTFLAPLVYVSNKELIDGHLNHASNLITEQTSQLRDLASQHTSQATETVKSYAGEYSQKAQEMIGQARGRVNGSSMQPNDFPTAPKTEPKTSEPKVSESDFPNVASNGASAEPLHAQ